MNKQHAVTFLTGYLKGLMIRYDIKEIDPLAVDCLRTLGANEAHLELFKKSNGENEDTRTN